MANRCCWPLFWLLLALMMRADDQCAQAEYPKRTQFQPRASAHATRHATTNRIRPTQAAGGNWEPVVHESAGNEIPNQNQTFSKSAMVQRREVAQAPPVEYALTNESTGEEVYPEETYGEHVFGPVVHGEEGYGAEDFDDSYYGDDAWEEPHPPKKHGKLRQLFGTFMPEDGTWFRTSKNSPRSIGVGEPLKGTSWLNRPNSVSFFAGILNGDELISNRVDQGSALFGGFRLGWDFDHYWGLEARAGWSSPELDYTPAPAVVHVDGIFLADASFLYYPWGDSSWRPYGLLGMGMARFDFSDEVGQIHDEYLLGIPIGFGMKYMFSPNLVFRAEFLDNIACSSSGLNNMNNLSFTLGMELRYGGKPRSYYPWQPAKYIW